VRVKQPTMVAAEATADGRRWGYYVALDAIRDDRKGIADVLADILRSPDSLDMIRALVADLGGENLDRSGAGARANLIAAGHSVLCAEFGGPCPKCSPSPPTLPGPTEHATVLLRYRYLRRSSGGYFGNGESAPVFGFPASVAGARVCVHYSHAEADGVAAMAEAERMKGRLLEAGARSVEMVGEVEGS